MLSYENFCKYAGNDFNQRKFVGGYRVYDTEDYIFQIGVFGNEKNNLQIKGLCLKTGKLADGFYQVDGFFKPDGEVERFDCKCPAGNSHQCKHIIGCLFYCMYNQNLGQVSCTDSPQLWNKRYKAALENYKPVPLEQHPCFSDTPPDNDNKLRNLIKEEKKNALKDSTNRHNNISSTKNKLTTIDLKSRKIKRVKPIEKLSSIKKDVITALYSKLSKSAYRKAVTGHHNPKKLKESIVSARDREIYKCIIQNQDSELMEMVSLFKVSRVEDCCQDVIVNLSVDAVELCENTRNWFAQWSKERKFRITASICYGLFTYTKNKNPDWKTKSNQFINPKAFKVEACEYGKKFEKQAREVFKSQFPNFEVVEAGLVISQVNPWLSASPDGVVLENGKPVSLLEIKCPTDGKTQDIVATVQNQVDGKQGCLVRHGEKVAMKVNHKYYGQVQLGMAVLNVSTCQFVIYSSFDSNVHVTVVNIDMPFLTDMLTKLKSLYFSVLLPEICLQRNPTGSLHTERQHYNYSPGPLKKKEKLKKK